ncbi:MAG: CPBP family glutamic-type intramembrane protease [Planctomycetota bacterium]|nr:CPBP family glutamic-type intramembrane protease [Planctomycetota bacterium]
MARANYWKASRDPAVSYIFLIPLLAIYEIGVFFVPSALNGADYMFKSFFTVFGQWGILILNLIFLALLFFSMGRATEMRKGRPAIYWSMAAESAAWAVVLLVGAFAWGRWRLQLAVPKVVEDVIASAGAGLYEEAVFRFLLLGGLVALIRDFLRGPPSFAVPVAIGISAALFSYAHHAIGGEAWDPAVFWFRTMMGVLLGGIYLLRGLGIVAYAHALYNVFVAVLQSTSANG